MTKTATKTANSKLFGPQLGAPQGEQTVMPPEAKAEQPKPARKNAVAVKADAPPPATLTEFEQTIAMFERAIRDPAVDVTKAREIMAMRKELEAERSQRIFNDAMAAAQSEIGMVGVDRNNPQTKSRYASYPALDRAIRPIYSRHGFAISFDTEKASAADFICVACFVSCAGHTRTYRIDMPADGKGAKGGDVMTKTHATGSAVSYGMRYLLKMIFNVATGEDDDGNKATAKAKDEPAILISKQQMQDIIKAVEFCGVGEGPFCKHYKIEKIPDLPASLYEDAMTACKNFADKKKEKSGGEG